MESKVTERFVPIYFVYMSPVVPRIYSDIAPHLHLYENNFNGDPDCDIDLNFHIVSSTKKDHWQEKMWYSIWVCCGFDSVRHPSSLRFFSFCLICFSRILKMSADVEAEIIVESTRTSTVNLYVCRLPDELKKYFYFVFPPDHGWVYNAGRGSLDAENIL